MCNQIEEEVVRVLTRKFGKFGWEAERFVPTWPFTGWTPCAWNDWGWGLEETCEHLLEKSSKARKNGEAYARLTAQRAAAAIHRHDPSPRLESLSQP